MQAGLGAAAPVSIRARAVRHLPSLIPARLPASSFLPAYLSPAAISHTPFLRSSFHPSLTLSAPPSCPISYPLRSPSQSSVATPCPLPPLPHLPDCRRLSLSFLSVPISPSRTDAPSLAITRSHHSHPLLSSPSLCPIPPSRRPAGRGRAGGGVRGHGGGQLLPARAPAAPHPHARPALGGRAHPLSRLGPARPIPEMNQPAPARPGDGDSRPPAPSARRRYGSAERRPRLRQPAAAVAAGCGSRGRGRGSCFGGSFGGGGGRGGCRGGGGGSRLWTLAG
jgi:hypothetical protein